MLLEHQANNMTSNAELQRRSWLVENETVHVLIASVHHNWSDNCRRKRVLKWVSHAISIMNLALKNDFSYQLYAICNGRRLTEKARGTKAKANKFLWNMERPFEQRTICFLFWWKEFLSASTAQNPEQQMSCLQSIQRSSCNEDHVSQNRDLGGGGLGL